MTEDELANSGKRAEKERESTVDFLRLVNESRHKKDMILEAVTFFRQHSGCDAVGVRLHEGDDYPYYEVHGMPAEFVLAENSLCSRSGAGDVIRDSTGNTVFDCMCENIICGRFDPSKPFFTKNGSFWTNSTTELLASATESDRGGLTRNRCNGAGYESVALIALRVGEDRMGLLQLNDRRKGFFSPENIALWERLAGYLAMALAKFRTEESLHSGEELYRSLFENMLNGFAYCRMLFSRDQPQDFIYLAVNAAFTTLTGLKNVVGKRVTEVIPGIRESDPELFEIYGRVALSGKPDHFEKYIAALGMWFSISVYSPRKEHFVAVFDIITERKLAEEKLRETAELTQALLKLNQMTEASVHDVTDYALEESIRLTQSKIGYLAFLNDDESVMNLHSWSNSVMEECEIADKPIHFQVDKTGLLGEAVRLRRPVITNDYEAANPLKKGLPHGHVKVSRHMNVPVFHGQRIVLVAGVGNKENAYSEDDVNLLTLMMKGMWWHIERMRAQQSLQNSEEKYRSIFEESRDMIYISTPDGKFVDVNPAGVYLTGYLSKEALLPVVVVDIFARPADRDRFLDLLNKNGFVTDFETTLLRHDGQEIQVSITAAAIRDALGTVTATRGIIRDITERSKAEERLERINHRNKLILNSASEGILGLNSQGRHTFVNPAAARMLGYSVDELLDRFSHPTWHHTKTDGSPYPEEECPIYGSFSRGVVSDRVRNEVFWRKDGTSFPVAYTSTPIVEHGEVAGAVVNFIDITQRKKAEDVLKTSEENFRLLMDRNPVAMAVAEKSGKFIYFNSRFIETLGYTLEDMPTVDDWWPLAYPDKEYRQRVISSWRAAARKAIRNRNQTESQEWRVRCKDGTSRDIEFRMASLPDVNIVIFNDITERRKAGETIRQLAAIVEFSDDAIFSVTMDGIIISWNNGARKLYGYTKGEATNHSVSMLIPPARLEESPLLLERIRRGVVVDHYETVRRRKDGSLIDVALTMSPIKSAGKITGASVIVRDITEVKKKEELLRRLSTTDELTGLANRRSFDLFFDEEWRRALRDRRQISMMMIDVDYFKQYNDTYGHLKGDACLKSVAEVLEGVSRRPGDKVARFGGEEFVVVLSSVDIEHAVSIAEKIRMDVEALRIPHEKSDISDHLTISIGVVSIIPQQNISQVYLIKSADEALYRAKEEGRNRVIVQDSC